MHAVVLGDEAGAWERLGFAVDSRGRVVVGGVTLHCRGGGGARRWVLGGRSGPGEVDGIPTDWAPTPREAGRAASHPNGAVSVDHIVVLTDSVARTVTALQAVDGDLRRRAEPPAVPVEMAFVRLGGVVVEVAAGGASAAPAGASDAGPGARIWGLGFVVPDVDELAARFRDAVGKARNAVQPGRRIVTARPAAGLDTAVAFLTPRRPRA